MLKIKRWNKKYGNDAKFVVQNEQGEFTEFCVGRPNDFSWTDKDLTQSTAYNGWDDWKDEPVPTLASIVM